MKIDTEIKSHIPRLRDDEYAILEASIIAEGCRDPLVLCGDVLIDGHNRYAICQEHGIEYSTRVVDLPDREAVIAWIEDNQLGRRNLTPDQFAYFIGRKYSRVKKAEGAPKGNSNRTKQLGQNDPVVSTAAKIAAEHGTSEATVKRAEKYAESIDVIAEVAGDNFRESVLSGDMKLTRQEVGQLAEEVGSGATKNDIEEKIHNHRAQGTGENEWYTPGEYIDAVREVLGTITLDPASSEHANKTVQAVTFCTQEDDGLTKEWAGKIYLNPPYSQPAIAHFAEKMAAEWESGRVDQAIMLTHNYTDTKWFHRLAGACNCICFTRGRIGFLSPEGKKAAPTQGQAFFYFGDNTERFAEVFGRVGFVVEVRHGF